MKSIDVWVCPFCERQTSYTNNCRVCKAVIVKMKVEVPELSAAEIKVAQQYRQEHRPQKIR
ncbi:hypothetical protein GJU41_12510 [Bacillus idriensis]|uniref:Uncharacterized protein n=1 Tax=Metabacillus idriensis TaxID=324768 RepID=A0A6I2MBW2_9BACI|nr:hypothetical protein [Metabacillus idriensis]MRX54797.1 hypothetical protein [Metabacillus idriensis]